MPQYHLSIAVCFLVASFFGAQVWAQQNPQIAEHASGWARGVSHQNQQQQFTNANVQELAPQPHVAAPAYDPIPSLSAKINSLQCQIDSLRASGNSNDGISRNNACACGLYLGATAVFAKPHYKEAFQYSQTNFATGQQSLIPFEYDYQATPRVWLGYKRSDGFGFRATYWNFNGDGQTSTNVADGINVYGAHAVNIIFPANIFAAIPGETMTNSDSLKTEIQNYDLTYDANSAGFEIISRLGLRYARLAQTLNSVVQDPAGIPTAQLNWRREYDGLGPSVSVEAKKRLGCTPFSFFATGGGAFLFGTKTLDRTVFGDQSPQPAAPFLSLEDADEVVGIGELGLGIEWSRRLANGYHLKIQSQYEGQLWAEAGAPTLGFLGFEGFAAGVELKR